mgnify:CR=1 FL=1
MCSPEKLGFRGWTRHTRRAAARALLETGTQRIQRFTAPETLAHLRAGALVVDIRPVAQRAAHGVVPGALCIDCNVLEWRLDPSCDFRIPEVTGPERPVIVLCQQGSASSLAADSLRALGYTHAGDLIEGFDGWRAAGLPTAEFSPSGISLCMLDPYGVSGMAANNHTARETESPAGGKRRRKAVAVRPRRGAVPDDFTAALARVPRAEAFFEKLGVEHRRDLLRRLRAVRRVDTRGKRIALIVAMLARRERVQP